MTKKIAILATDNFEDSELREPYERLRDAGFKVLVVGPTAGELTGFLDHCRRKRHEIAYGTRSAVSPGEVEELIASVDELDGRVRTWLRRRHAGLNA